MKTILTLAALLMATTPVLAEDAAPSSAAPAAKPYICLRHADVDGWGTRDKHSMVVSDRFGRKYLVGLNGLCDDLNFSMGAGFRPLGSGAWPCVDRGDRIVMSGAITRTSTCWVNKVQFYTKDMEAADKLARENKQPLAAY